MSKNYWRKLRAELRWLFDVQDVADALVKAEADLAEFRILHADEKDTLWYATEQLELAKIAFITCLWLEIVRFVAAVRQFFQGVPRGPWR